jgi:hypothetical protein
MVTAWALTHQDVVSPSGFSRAIFKHLEPIDDLGTALGGFGRGTRRFVSEDGDRLIKHVPIMPT